MNSFPIATDSIRSGSTDVLNGTCSSSWEARWAGVKYRLLMSIVVYPWKLDGAQSSIVPVGITCRNISSIARVEAIASLNLGDERPDSITDWRIYVLLWGSLWIIWVTYRLVGECDIHSEWFPYRRKITLANDALNTENNFLEFWTFSVLRGA